MAETLLTPSEILLFGRKVEDLKIAGVATDGDQQATVTTTRHVKGGLKGHKEIDGVPVSTNNTVLVRHHGPEHNGLYTVKASTQKWDKGTVAEDETVSVERGTKCGGSLWRQTEEDSANKQRFAHIGGPGRGEGRDNQLDKQLGDDACFARIYGFSYEGTYYELPSPTLFLVHGEGESATDNLPSGQGARAPFDPSRTGVGAADFQFANDIRVWAYDKGDYSIRMDVMSGQLDEVLLDIFFEVEAPMLAGGRVSGGRVAGGRVAGGRVAGGRVAGGRVAGGRVAGGRVSGGRVSGSDD